MPQATDWEQLWNSIIQRHDKRLPYRPESREIVAEAKIGGLDCRLVLLEGTTIDFSPYQKNPYKIYVIEVFKKDQFSNKMFKDWSADHILPEQVLIGGPKISYSDIAQQWYGDCLAQNTTLESIAQNKVDFNPHRQMDPTVVKSLLFEYGMRLAEGVRT
jgi:hypothetical protein